VAHDSSLTQVRDEDSVEAGNSPPTRPENESSGCACEVDQRREPENGISETEAKDQSTAQAGDSESEADLEIHPEAQAEGCKLRNNLRNRSTAQAAGLRRQEKPKIHWADGLHGAETN